MIDAYDVLGVSVDADADTIKKAFRRLSLQHHPDKVQASDHGGSIGNRFNEIRDAYDCLQDPTRRRVYDAFGLDLGQENPEQEVWSIGMNNLVVPMGLYMMKTTVAITLRWLLDYFVVKLALLLSGALVALLSFNDIDFSFRIGRFCLQKATPVLINLGALCALALVQWIWPLAFDMVCIFYLCSEALGIEMIVQSQQVFYGVLIGCPVTAWLVRRRWHWVLGAVATISGIVLLSCCVSVAVMRLYIEHIEQEHQHKVRERRLFLRQSAKKLSDEAARLRERLQKQEGAGAGGPRAPRRGRGGLA